MISPRTLRNLRSELSRSLLAKLGIAILAVILFIALFAPLLAPHDPTEQDLDNTNIPPLGFTATENQTTSEMVDGEVKIVEKQVVVNTTAEHPLGTDSLGRDVLSRTMFGARTSLLVGLFGTAIAVVLGVTVGITAGYYGGRIDDALMRFADVMLAFPSLVLAIALIGLWGQASLRLPDPLVASGIASQTMPESIVLPGTVIAVVALVNWVWFARVARGEALSVRDQEYVKAARSMGGSDLHVILKHVLPNSLTPILVLATIQIAAIILLESSLSFLGFSGAQLSWGFDIAQGRQYLSSSWWIATVPGLAIVAAVVGINLIGDWLRDALDPGIEGQGGAS
ncbi:peptide ABC transporter permease [Halorubrum persicum]|uniref:Peptide ABC transporter permease n=1 Tax=Halorubrum persicum TaxID=1383844 RepID=A0A2G1WL85_9EURY|nr:ABC transporter permease [Halorubrum persicum]PHQ39705.1 peptide ABC transporter permease [Halorubrum persicum]